MDSHLRAIVAVNAGLLDSPGLGCEVRSASDQPVTAGSIWTIQNPTRRVALTVTVPAFRNPSASFPERAADLLARLTGDENIAMLHQLSPHARSGRLDWFPLSAPKRLDREV